MDTPFDQAITCDSLNKHLKFDGFEIVLVGEMPRIRDVKGSEVEFRSISSRAQRTMGACSLTNRLRRRMTRSAKATTTAQSPVPTGCVEAVFQELERELTGKNESYDGDLPRLYKRVGKQLNLDPARKDIEASLKQVLSGLHRHRWGAIRCEQQDG